MCTRIQPLSYARTMVYFAGYTCDVASAVGGHYYDVASGEADPWATTQYTTDAMGCATVNIDMPSFSLDSSWPVAYRAVVAHLSTDVKVSCGLIGTPSAAVAMVGAYPAYTGILSNVTGTVVVQDSASGITMTGTLAGLEANVVGGIHVHVGTTCETAESVGGHYYPGMATRRGRLSNTA